MKSSLARVLLQKGVIRQGTVAESYQNVRGLSCIENANVLTSFIIFGARLLDGEEIVFDSLNTKQVSGRLPSEAIVTLDGMLIERIASSHNLTLDGQQLAVCSRRGRRRKSISCGPIADATKML